MLNKTAKNTREDSTFDESHFSHFSEQRHRKEYDIDGFATVCIHLCHLVSTGGDRTLSSLVWPTEIQ